MNILGKIRGKVEGSNTDIKFLALWRRVLLDNLKKDSSSYFPLRNYNFYSNGLATFSGKDLITFYYTIDGYPKSVPKDYRSDIRCLAHGGTRISFISTFEPTSIDWNSPKMKSKLKTWKNLEEDGEAVDEYNLYQNQLSLDSIVWRKQSLVYLSDAQLKRFRNMFKYRTIIYVSGKRGKDFDKTIKQVKKYCSDRGIKITRVEGKDLFEYIRSFSPFTMEMDASVLKGVGCNTIPDELIARFNTYDQGKIGKKGLWWGTDIYSGFPVYKVVKKTDVDTENILIAAETGGGKSFFLKAILLQLIALPEYNGTINDIEGFEYTPFAGFIANQDSVVIVNMAEGQGCYYDPVEICLTGNSQLDEGMFSFSRSCTISIFKVLIGEDLLKNPWSNIIINNAVGKVYSNRGVDMKDMSTWANSKGLTLHDVYNEFKKLYKESLILISKYGYSNSEIKNLDKILELDLSQQYKRNTEYKEALDKIIAQLGVYFETLENGGTRSDIFSVRVTLEEISSAKLVVCSFGMAGKTADNIDPIQMNLSQLYASSISHLRSIFSKAQNKFNFKVWEEFQRWGSFKGSETTIKTALTGGRKLGDINFIVTNNISELLDNDRFAMFNNISTFAIGAIKDDDVRSKLCNKLSVPLLKPDLDSIVTKKGNKESFESEEETVSMYDKAFLVSLDGMVSTITKMTLPKHIADSDLFKTGTNTREQERQNKESNEEEY